MKQVGITPEGQPVVDGVFILVGTHGIPLEVVLDGMKQRSVTPCWQTYIRDARKDGAKDRTIRARITAAVGEVYGPNHLKAVEERLDQWM